jgi:hypothetical protein
MTPHPEPSPVGVLYSPRQIALAAFLGSPIAAAWFFHRNFLTLHDDQRAWRAISFGVAATAAVVALALVLPPQFPKPLLPLLYTAAIDIYASTLFRKRLEEHISVGGRKGSWWMVVGIGLFALLVVFGVLLAMVSTMPTLFPD